MTTYHGNNGAVKIGSDTVAEIQSFNYTETSRLAEDSAMGDTAATHVAGKSEASGSITCHYDSGDSTGQAVLTAGASVTLLLHPEGTATGRKQISVPAILSGVGFTAEQEGIVSANFDFTRSGDDTHSTQA